MIIVTEGRPWWTAKVVKCNSCGTELKFESSDVPLESNEYNEAEVSTGNTPPTEMVRRHATFRCIRCTFPVDVMERVAPNTPPSPPVKPSPPVNR